MSTQQESKPLLRIRDLRKRYGDLTVLDGIDLDLPQGQTYSIIGRSGSGKSTLLRCVQLLEESEFASMELAGQPFGYRIVNGEQRRLNGRELAAERSKTGMVFQSFNLFPHMSVLNNVMEAPVHVKGVSRDEAAEVAQALLARVGLTDKADAYPATLSGGQQQRVAIARALAMSPMLMLFDEPTSALDPELVGEVLSVMRDISVEGMTMLVVTHEMRFAESASDQVVFIDQGKVVEMGPPEQVLGAPERPETQQFLKAIL